jgi:hypothetical protein
MLDEKDILDKAGIDSFIESLKPELEKEGYHFFEDRHFCADICIGKIKSGHGKYLIGRGTTSRIHQARPIEALCFLGYETFHPSQYLANTFFQPTTDAELLELRRVVADKKILEGFEQIISQTKEFENRLIEFCRDNLARKARGDFLAAGHGMGLSDYQNGAVMTYLSEAPKALEMKGKDNVATNNYYPFREMRTEYFRGEPRHMRPALIQASQTLQDVLLEKARAEHKNIFGNELKVNPKGYEEVYPNRF